MEDRTDCKHITCNDYEENFSNFFFLIKKELQNSLSASAILSDFNFCYNFSRSWLHFPRVVLIKLNEQRTSGRK